MTNKRLKTLVDWIDGTILADVGCDHAYVAVDAVRFNKVKKAYACDIAPQPLERAAQTIAQYELEDQVETKLMNGIDQLPNEVDVVVIAGLGATTIQEILNPQYLKEGLRLLLSPHKDVEHLRKDLMEKNIEIVKECIVYDQGHYYPILDCVVSNQDIHYTKKQQFLGVNVIKDETYKQYISYLYNKMHTILKQIPEGVHPIFSGRIEILKEEKETL